MFIYAKSLPRDWGYEEDYQRYIIDVKMYEELLIIAYIVCGNASLFKVFLASNAW